MIWYRIVKQKLEACGVFRGVSIIGAKIRANVDDTVFLEMYFDPCTKSYSYGLVDLSLPYPDDKRVLGWDDYPHEGVKDIKHLKNYPHHFQQRVKNKWVFEESPMRGNIEKETDIVIKVIMGYLRSHHS